MSYNVYFLISKSYNKDKTIVLLHSLAPHIHIFYKTTKFRLIDGLTNFMHTIVPDQKLV